jgi:hypothetical protein
VHLELKKVAVLSLLLFRDPRLMILRATHQILPQPLPNPRLPKLRLANNPIPKQLALKPLGHILPTKSILGVRKQSVLVSRRDHPPSRGVGSMRRTGSWVETVLVRVVVGVGVGVGVGGLGGGFVRGVVGSWRGKWAGVGGAGEERGLVVVGLGWPADWLSVIVQVWIVHKKIKLTI